LKEQNSQLVKTVKEYCENRNLKFVPFESKQNWKVVPFQVHYNPSEIVLLGVGGDMIRESFYKEIDKEFESTLKQFQLKKVSCISVSNQNRIVIK